MADPRQKALDAGSEVMYAAGWVEAYEPEFQQALWLAHLAIGRRGLVIEPKTETTLKPLNSIDARLARLRGER